MVELDHSDLEIDLRLVGMDQTRDQSQKRHGHHTDMYIRVASQQGENGKTQLNMAVELGMHSRHSDLHIHQRNHMHQMWNNKKGCGYQLYNALSRAL